MNNGQNDHFESVHLLRGIAAMLVLMAHSFRSYYFWDVPWFEKSVLDFGQIGVSVFFVISGFVLPLSLQKSYRFQDFPRFLARRFVRIEPTYLASMVITIAWLWTATRLAPNASPWQFDLGQIGAHLLYLVPFMEYKWVNEVYWTLAIEFQFYLFIGVLFTIFRGAAHKNLILAGVLILACSSVIFLAEFCAPIQLLHYAPFFGIGMLGWLASCYSIPLNKHSFILAALVLIGYFGGLSLPNLLFGALAFFLILYWKPRKSKWRFFGTISYSLYVIHYPIISLEHVIGLRLVGTAFKPFLFVLPIATMAVCILAAWILYKLVEEPTMKFSKIIGCKSAASI
jgi:peptidoglycan/LPS O-acetylase OafA/YrhL